MNKFGSIVGINISIAAQHPIFNQAVRELESALHQERQLANLAVLWQCSVEQATDKAQKINARTGKSLDDIIWQAKLGARFPD